MQSVAVTRGIQALPDMYALGPHGLCLICMPDCPREDSRAYISGKALMPVLQLLHI